MTDYIRLGLMILLTTIIIYAVLNTLLRYHVSIEVYHLAMLFVLVFMMIRYIESQTYTISLWVSGSIVVVFSGVKVFMSMNRIFPYVLLNVSKKDYEEVHNFLLSKMKDVKKPNSRFYYDKKIPFLLVFDGITSKEANLWVKDIDKLISKKPKVLAWFQYVYFLVGMILIVLLWRF